MKGSWQLGRGEGFDLVPPSQRKRRGNELTSAGQ